MKIPYATALLSALSFLLLCGAPMQAQAAIVINTTETQYEPGGVRYSFTVQDWSQDYGETNPCMQYAPGETICRVSIAVNKRPGIYDPVGWYYRTWELPVKTGGSASLYLLYLDLLGLGQAFWIPLSSSILVPYQNAGNELCVTFTYSKVGNGAGGDKGLFGPCTRVATPPLKCEIKGNPTINHKNLPDNALDGVKASTQLSLKCLGPASVTVSASRTNSFGVQLRSDNSLYSKITVNGKDATEGINIPVDGGLASPLNITSTLVTRGTVLPGAFSGSTVITVSPP